ncbi:hypothetical protein TNCV_4575891 [Trichonephila clavipes]|nr:hypothetical protein TNCV_4575891 [Trichonephila clavipes]
MDKTTLPAVMKMEDLINGECTIPEKLDRFFKTLIGGKDIRGRDGANCHRLSNPLASDAIYCTYRSPPRSERYGSARCWQQWITEGKVYRRGGSGRPRNTNDREDRAIRRVATSAPTTSLASIQRHLPPSRHPVTSRETIRDD